MSHEIRTPLNGVIGMTSLLMETSLTSDQWEFADIARSSGQTLLALVNNILDVSKVEAGRLELESIDFDLVAVIDSAVDSVALRAADKGLEVIVDVEPCIRRHFRGDPTRLGQVLLNLLSNAAKFTEHGAVGLSLRVNADPKAAELIFVVWDTGIGISADRIGALFAPFIQADSSTTRRFGGSGLGLAIAKQLAMAMGGSIDVRSEAGKGTAFTLSLRLAESEDAGAEVRVQALPGLKVLVASCEERATSIYCEHLRAAGAEVAVTESAPAALDQYRQRLASGTPPFAVIVDQRLAEGADWLAQAIRSCGAPPPALLLLRSLSHSKAQKNEPLFDRVVYKPVKPQMLLRVLGELSQPTALPTLASADSDPVLNPGFRVLVVDDNAVNQKVVTHLLRKQGAVVSNAANGIEALETLRIHNFDVVLMDCQMPEMDGYEATRRLRLFGPEHPNRNIPVIALTANALATDREKCAVAGMNHYLSKPIDRQRLQQALASAFAGAARPGIVAQVGNIRR